MLYAAASTGLIALARQAPPVCLKRELRAGVGVPTQVLLPCTDPNGDALTYAIASKADARHAGCDQGRVGHLQAEARLSRPGCVRHQGRRRLRRRDDRHGDGARHARRHRARWCASRGPLKVRAGTAHATIGCDARTAGGCTGVAILRLGGPRGPVVARTKVHVAAGRAHVIDVPLQRRRPHRPRAGQLAPGHADRDRARQERQRRHARPQGRPAQRLQEGHVGDPRRIRATVPGCAGSLIALVLARARCRPRRPPSSSSGLQDDAYLSSADPRAWQLTRELRPDVIRYNVDWSSVARMRPQPAGVPGRPGLRLGGAPTASSGNAARQGARVLLTIVQAPGWANGGGAPRSGAARPRATTGRSAGRSRRATRAASSRAGAQAPLPRGDELHGLERAQPRAVPASRRGRTASRRPG